MPDMVERPDVVRDNPNVKHYHSNFALKEVRLTTEQFGLIKPHMIIDSVSTDDFDYRPEYKTRSYTLKAPLMQDVHRKLSYVKVDLPAILPFNFEKFYSNPVIGDDVPVDCGLCLENGCKTIYDAVSSFISMAWSETNKSDSSFTVAQLTVFLKALIFGELFYSRGSLLSSLGAHLSKQFYVVFSNRVSGINDFPTEPKSFDFFFDYIIGKIISFLYESHDILFFTARVGSKTFYVNISGEQLPTFVGSNGITFREFLSEIRSTGDWEITGFSGPTPITVISDRMNLTFTCYSRLSVDVPFNIGRVCAYQLAVAEYFTNDKVDHIYSAELYRQYLGHFTRVFTSSLPRFFSVNGLRYEYDFLSAHYVNYAINFYKNSTGNGVNNPTYEYVLNLFSLKRSLRYKDYFVSSRTRPLAVGDVSVSVDNNSVSVIDISRNIQIQRFLNAVNHSGRRISNYIKTLFGNNISPDRCQPHWLADIDEMVYTSEVENTGESQVTNANSVTAVFTGNSGSKQLKFYCDLPGFIIGLTSYDIERAYPDSVNRSFFIRDRFDMFLPQLQFVGDQPILSQELDSSSPDSFGTAFGYQYRDMQHKLLYSVADGGFVEFLPGYGYIYKPDYFKSENISPDFIRSKVSELDEFYLSLTGFSLASYFHFISVITNNFSANRPMIANPKILE